MLEKTLNIAAVICMTIATVLLAIMLSKEGFQNLDPSVKILTFCVLTPYWFVSLPRMIREWKDM